MYLIIHVSTPATYVVQAGMELSQWIASDQEDRVFIEPVVLADLAAAEQFLRDGLGWNGTGLTVISSGLYRVDE